MPKVKQKNIIFTLLTILLVYPPYLRGLFFDKELLPTQVFAFAVTAIWLISRYKDKDYKLVKTPVDMLALGVVFMYLISTIYGVNTRLALGEFLKYANYFAIFILARDIVNDDNKRKWLLTILLLSGAGVAIVGIGSAIGTWDYNGAYVGYRLSSTFQYPNTLASYLGAMFILSIGLTSWVENKKLKCLYGALSGIYIFAFILTYSRGMWILLPFMLLIFIIFVPNKRKLEIILYIIAAVISAVPLSFLFANRLQNSQDKLWIIFISAAVLSTVLTLLVSIIEEKLRKVTIKKLLISFGVVVIILAVAITYMVNATTTLTLSNNGDKDKWSTVYRSVGDILPNEEYQLTVKYDAEINDEKPYAGRVRIYSVDEQDNNTKIEFVNIEDTSKKEITIPFTTLDNTEGLRIYFDNYYTNTSITYNEAVVTKEDNVVKDIPLKYKYIPERIVQRFDNISLKENSASGRLAFYRDGFKIVKDYPIFGTGGGGWVTLYQIYQSYNYPTTQAHNHFLQLWIEVGTIGLLLYVGFLVLLTIYLIKKYMSDSSDYNRLLLATIFMAAASILSHAFMDFDLSLSGLTYILWALLGIAYGTVEYDKIFTKNEEKTVKRKKYTSSKVNVIPLISTIALIALMIISSKLAYGLYKGQAYAEKAIEANSNGNTDEAMMYFEKAVEANPYEMNYKVDLTKFYRLKYTNTKDNQYLIKHKKLVDDAMNINPYSTVYKALASSYYMSIGEIDKSLELINEAVELNPMRLENYAQKCDAYLAAFYYYVNQKKDTEKAQEIINEAYKIKEQVQKITKTAIRPMRYNEDLLYKLGYIQFYYENINNKEYNIPKGYTLDFAYYFDLDMDNNGKIDKLAIWNPEGGNVQYELMSENDSSFIRITNDGEKYGIVYPYGLKLEPDTDYKVYFKARGTVKDGTFKFYVWDNKAKDRNQGELKGIKLDNNWNIYELDIHTDEDIEPGSQYLRFQHNGNDEGYIDVEEVLAFRGE